MCRGLANLCLFLKAGGAGRNFVGAVPCCSGAPGGRRVSPRDRPGLRLWEAKPGRGDRNRGQEAIGRPKFSPPRSGKDLFRGFPAQNPDKPAKRQREQPAASCRQIPEILANGPAGWAQINGDLPCEGRSPVKAQSSLGRWSASVAGNTIPPGWPGQLPEATRKPHHGRAESAQPRRYSSSDCRRRTRTL